MFSVVFIFPSERASELERENISTEKNNKPRDANLSEMNELSGLPSRRQRSFISVLHLAGPVEKCQRTVSRQTLDWDRAPGPAALWDACTLLIFSVMHRALRQVAPGDDGSALWMMEEPVSGTPGPRVGQANQRASPGRPREREKRMLC